MDSASLGISVVSLAIQVFNAASDGYSSLRQTEDPETPLADEVGLQVQQCRFISWAKATGLSDERLSQFGDPFMQQTVLNVLCNMLQLLQDATKPKNKYGLAFELPDPSVTDLSEAPQQALASYPPGAIPSDTIDTAMMMTVRRPETVQALLASARASFSVFQQSRWIISDRRLFSHLIRQLRETNDNLESLVPHPIQISAAELGETTMLQSEDVGHLKRVAQVASSSWISLAQSANFKSHYIDTDTNRDVVNQAKFIPRAQLALDSTNGGSRTLATFELDGPASVRVFVEWKRTGILKNAVSVDESERIILDRIKRLAVILACPTDVTFRSLACIGYTTSTSGRIGLVFKLPNDAAKASPSVSLLELLKSPDRTTSPQTAVKLGKVTSKKPALEERLRFCHALALSIYRLHRTGVIHKHITSANIIFFPHKSTTVISILEPFLTGFDFAREESMANQSEIPNDQIDGEDLYRHPSWELGKPSSKAVDIYALGILLIEIASWEPIKRAKEKADRRAVTDFCAFLLAEFVDSGFLAYRMGTDYQNAVKHCLHVSLVNEEKDSGNILGPFYGNVVQGLSSFLSK